MAQLTDREIVDLGYGAAPPEGSTIESAKEKLLEDLRVVRSPAAA